MDLSKAFDCLPHRRLLEKLRAYNLAESAVSLLGSYLSDREQCVKIGNAQSRVGVDYNRNRNRL